MKIEIRSLSQDEIEEQGILAWPVWTCQISTFTWKYDSKETCYILEGEVEIETSEETIRFGPGDRVIFPQGLECTWKVLKPVRKHYRME